MLRFGLRLLAFGLLQGVLFLGVVWDPDYPRQNGFLAATIDKHRRLERTPPPRIILSGGSNVPMGFQSPLLEREVHRPVVNLGLVAGLGAGFMLNELAEAVTIGDTVVLSLEYTIFGGTDHRLHQRQLLEYRPASWRYCAAGERWDLILEHGLPLCGGIVRRSLGLSRPDLEGPTLLPYRRDGFNEHGDYVLHYQSSARLADVPADNPRLTPAAVPSFSPRLRARLEAFALLAHNRGARVFYTCPPRPSFLWKVQREGVEAIVAGLRSIPHLEVLDAPTDHVYALELFADTVDHLTEEGARQRTLRVAARLSAKLREPSPIGMLVSIVRTDP